MKKGALPSRISQARGAEGHGGHQVQDLETLPAAEASGHEQNGRAGGADAGSEEWRLMPLLGLRGNGTFCLRYGFGE